MQYLIDEVVFFNPDNNTVWRYDDPENKFKLPRFACYLLEVLIKNNNSAMSREYLMNQVWECNGLESSGNSLNNYISIIRRTLLKLGLSGVILTIPKFGFSFAAQNIQQMFEEAEPEQPQEEEGVLPGKPADLFPVLSTPPDVERPVPPAVSLKIVIYCVTALLVLVCVFAASHYIDSHRHASLLNEHSQTAKINYQFRQCTVYVIKSDDDPALTKEKVIRSFESFTREKILDCDKQADVYYYRSALAYTEEGWTLSFCRKEKKKHCHNFGIDGTQPQLILAAY